MDGSIFLSASFPSGQRGVDFEPYDAGGIGDAVSACVKSVLGGARALVFGGHPTITPVILLIADELEVRGMVHVYQSRWFEDRITPETRRLEDLGYGVVHWTPAGASLDESLQTLRQTMMSESAMAGGVFVGGMEGILAEYGMFRDLWPNSVALPVGGPGGAAVKLVEKARGNLPEHLAAVLESDRYPALFFEFMKAVDDARESGDSE